MGRKGLSASRASWGCSPRRSSSFRSHSGLRLGGAGHWGIWWQRRGAPHCPIMASALTVLLGCWLAGRSGAWGEREFLKPTIWVSPSRVVALGGNVTIRCEGRHRSMKFFLRKDGRPNPQVKTVPNGTVAEFPIPSVSRENGGSYTCEYHSITEQNRSSHPSDPVKIIVGEPSYPKPSISLSPSGGVSLGGIVAVWCRVQRPGMRFVLNKERRHFPLVDSDRLGVVFSISNVSQEDGGSYSCYYYNRSEPLAVSYPSDPVELVVRGGQELKLTIPIIAGVSAAAAGLLLLLLLLLAFVCCRRTRGRKGPAPRQSRESEAAAAVSALIGEGKQLDEPDPGAEGLTYAELDGQALQAKRGGPAPAPEPVLYATINVSRGPHGQRPQGSGAPPTHSP
ncbi:T-cell-interacting, activating receptor on myeloid cells protein 1-like isoform 3-T3 [Macrochelys suwanniensis]